MAMMKMMMQGRKDENKKDEKDKSNQEASLELDATKRKLQHLQREMNNIEKTRKFNELSDYQKLAQSYKKETVTPS